MTAETTILFPKFFVGKDKFYREFEEVSLFGLHKVATGSAASLKGTNTTLLGTSPGSAGLAGVADQANFQVFAVRDGPNSDDVYFKL